MKTTLRSHDAPLDGDDRLMDALLREHARAGSQPDQAFLGRLDIALGAESAESPGSHRIATLPAARMHPSRRLAWSLGLAASVALAAGLLWKNPFGGDQSPVAAPELASSGGMPLLTSMPPELIEGTPKPINLPHLVPSPTSAPTLLVPEGTVLLSKGKPVTSSDENPIIGSLDLITDGDKDAGEGYFVELWEGLHWVRIDLEESATISAVWLWHFHSQRRAYHDVIVQISDDPGFKTGVTTIFNNDYDNSARMGKGSDNPYVETHFGKLIDGRGARGRYVRLFSQGNSSNEMNHYIEVEVFGIPG